MPRPPAMWWLVPSWVLSLYLQRTSITALMASSEYLCHFSEESNEDLLVLSSLW